MKRLILIIIIAGAYLSNAWAQDEGFYRHYLLNPILVNPGYTGFQDHHNLLFNYNNQLSSWPGAPKTVTASYNGPVSERIGLGALLSSDNAGSLVRNRTQLSYAYKFILSNLDLSLGLSTTFEQSRLKGVALLDPAIDRQDPFLIDATSGLKLFDAAFGVHGKTEEFYFGLAAPNLIRARVNKESLVENETTSGFLKHFLAYVGYKWAVEDNNFYVEPSIMVKNLRNSPFMVDFNGKVYFFEDQLIGGLTYTLGGGDRFAILLGAALTNFDLYYSYTTSFQASQAYHSGAHEVSVQFTFGTRKNKLEDE
ncbi:MAG: PorP/SprF family type IX secretion system membrane protein [Saprospiraceae bacterium]|nr:PorP/SprF family type IX secretion system membrane protein [Saprospiraceae bacterium]